MKPKAKLPESFKQLLWSHDFSTIDPDAHKRTIVVNTLNYGTLEQWRWLVQYYGKENIRALLREIPATELRERVRPLISILFDISFKSSNYASRGTHRGR